MEKYMILIAGPPATGKSYWVAELEKALPPFFLIAPDSIKEEFSDRYGFHNLTEKEEVEKMAWKAYYKRIEEKMKEEYPIIVSEYPFSDKQKPTFEQFAKKYQYHVITIRLIADFEVLWARRRIRDREPSRHLTHIMSHYHKGDFLEDRTKADQLITKDEFQNVIQKKGYNTFSMGELYEIDMTDFQENNSYEVLNQIVTLLKKVNS